MEYIVPGFGIYNDTSRGFCPIVPGFGIMQEQTAAAGYVHSFAIVIG